MTSASRPDRPTQPVGCRFWLCADTSRQAGEDPIGTAPHWQEVTVLELDVPVWAKLCDYQNWTPEQVRVFERLRGKVEASGAGFGLLMSAPERPGQPLRARHYRLGAGGYHRQDYVSHLPQTEWARGLTDTLLEPENLSEWQVAEVPEGPDFHICTHGTVDSACGRYGAPVFLGMKKGGARAWRTGHFGGHRFAATAVELPSGVLWAHLTPDLALQVARREVEPADVRLNLRGYCGLPKLGQILDRELLVHHGWDWLSAERWAEVDGEQVTLHYVWQGQRGVAQARVTESHVLHVSDTSGQSELTEVKQYAVEW